MATCKLDELALKHGTDKSSLGHNYCPLYEKHLPEKINNLLEIGCWKGAGIKMFKEWYGNKGKFFVMDVFGGEVITQTELGSIGVNSFMGSQSDGALLRSIKEQFTVISEDASHHSDEQVITFREMFKNNVEPGGLYVLEDAMCARNEYWWRGVVKKFDDTALAIFQKYLAGGTLECDFITHEESNKLIEMIESVDIYNDAIIFIKRSQMFDLSTRETLIASLPKNGVVAEIGVEWGIFSKKIFLLNEPNELYLVDCWANQSEEVYGTDPANNTANHKNVQYESVSNYFSIFSNVFTVKGYSDVAAKCFLNNYFDWIYIDANHLQVRQDIEAWLPKVKSGGYITGHDYTMVGDYITVKRDVDEFVKENNLELFVTTGANGDIYEINYPSWGFKKP